MRTVVIALIAAAVGAAVAWSIATVAEQGGVPGDADQMHAQMSAALDNFGDTLARANAVTHLSKHLNAENVEGAVRAFRERAAAPQVNAFDIQVFFASWARLEGESILEQTKTWGADRFHRLATIAVLHELARQGEIDRARDVFFNTPEGTREQAVAALFVTWAQFDQLRDAQEIVLSFPEGSARDTAMQILANQILVSQGSEELIEWVEGLEAPGPEMFKHLAFEWAVKALAHESRDEARAWVLLRWADQQGWSRRGPEFLVDVWSRIDGQEAVEWALALAPDDGVMQNVRMRSAANGLKRWVKSNPSQAALWLEIREIKPWHDVHSEKLALHFARRAPRQAAVFSNRILDETRRNRVQKLLRRDWQRLANRDELYDMLGPDGPKVVAVREPES